jgi:Mor family transcriptional regulator
VTDPIEKYPDAHRELLEVVTAALVGAGMAPDVAAAYAEHVKERMRTDRTFAGRKIYIPSAKFTMEYMREEVGRRWDGTNTRELCVDLDIGETWLRKLHASWTKNRDTAKPA